MRCNKEVGSELIQGESWVFFDFDFLTLCTVVICSSFPSMCRTQFREHPCLSFVIYSWLDEPMTKSVSQIGKNSETTKLFSTHRQQKDEQNKTKVTKTAERIRQWDSLSLGETDNPCTLQSICTSWVVWWECEKSETKHSFSHQPPCNSTSVFFKEVRRDTLMNCPGKLELQETRTKVKPQCRSHGFRQSLETRGRTLSLIYCLVRLAIPSKDVIILLFRSSKGW
jgi:hypothetical protein